MHESNLEAPRRPAVLLILLLVALASLSAGSFAQEAGHLEDRVVRVVGHGVVHGQPDIATVELGVTATDADAGAAVQQIDRRMREVLAALSRLGIRQQDIRTTSYNIWREEQFPRDGEGSSQAVFRAQHMVAVELDGAERAGEVLAAAVDAGANAVGGISFGFSEPEVLEARARAEAMEDARLRAAQLAAAAGAGLGEALLIEEISGVGPSVPYAERYMSAASAAPISPGQLSAEVRVAVTYRLE